MDFGPYAEQKNIILVLYTEKQGKDELPGKRYQNCTPNDMIFP